MSADIAEIPGLTIEQELGRGASSVVYRARKGQQSCAVKIARRGGRTARWFRREAAALARVRHPGVPAVLEVGEIDGNPYLVMELVEGESLAARLRRGALQPSEVVTLARELASIVDAVHAQGLVHRDIKPGNILLDPSGRARLVDFGLVTSLYRVPGEGDRAGTRTYAAPEQMQAPQLVDARSDLFALGRVLADCMALLDEVPLGLQQVVQGLLAEDMSRRYPSGGALEAELARVERGEAPHGVDAPVGTCPPREALPLIGRERPLRGLIEAWGAAVAGRGRVVLVEGPPGAGKTRVTAALAEHVDREGFALRASATGGSPVPLATVRQLIDAILSVLSERSRDEATLAEFICDLARGPIAATVASLSPRLAALLGDPPAPANPDPEAFVEATASLLLDLVREAGPGLFAIDDLQWVDPLSREVLVRVALGAQDAPLLFLAAARTDARSLPNLQRFARALGRERLSVMDLSALGDGDLAALVAAYVGVEVADPRLVRRVASLADRTPMGVLEILAALVDNGALEPHWGGWRFDAARAEQIELPHGLSQVLERRLELLPVAARRTLEIGAVMGVRFSVERVARVASVLPADLQIALREASQAGVVDLREARPRFVHDSVRDALLRRLTVQERSALHQRIALVLDAEQATDPETVFATADHFALGEPTQSPERAYRAALLAARQAAHSLDGEVAMRFFEVAERCATAAGLPVDGELLRGLAESRIRVGALEESLPVLTRALALAQGELARAELLSRIAWVHQMRADPEQAWAAVSQAFETLGERVPTEKTAAMVRTAGRLALSTAQRRFAGALDAKARARLELLCALHYQNARLGVEYERPLRTLQSAIETLAIGERLGPSAHLAMAHAQYAIFMTVLGRRGAGRRHLEQARAMVELVGDPVAHSVAVQLDSMGSMWSGDMDRGLVLAREYLDRFGHWIEVSEYCLVSVSAIVIELTRGRHREAIAWLDRAFQRVRRYGRIPAVVTQLMVPALQAALAALGREHELSRFLPDLESVDEKTKSFFRVAAWGPKAQRLVESGKLGDELDELVAEFDAEGYDPRRVHLGVVLYYITLAHARCAQCREASPELRRSRIAAFDRALADLRKAARVELFVAHLRLLEGERALLVGDEARARKCFALARRLGEEQTAPWVLSAVALAEARLLAAKGRVDAARDEARIAAMLASSHGAMPRARAIMGEFGLRREDIGGGEEAPASSASEPSSWSSRRAQLRSLASVVRVGTSAAGLEVQARAVLDEIVRIVPAERGALLFERDAVEPTRVLLGRLRGSAEWSGIDPGYTAILKRVCDSGRDMLTGGQESSPHGSSRLDAHRMIAVPLWLQHEVVGALLLERAEGQPAFSVEEAQVVATLAPQVPLALELARLLEERDRLGETLRHAQKMEAVGQLASGVAHDFNNVLAAISASLDVLGDEHTLAPEQANALSIVRDSVHRASDLTRHLLAFSRRQVLDLVPVDVGAVLHGLRPMLQRLIGERITVDLRCDEGVCPVKTDRTSLEQAIINLVVNARDAMPSGGEIRLVVEEIFVDETGLVLGASRTGPHVRIEVTDTGTGMPPAVAEKVFEPFFTTKPVGSGTGLGLASVYGFVKQCGGHIDVASTVGVGSTFIILLPAAETTSLGALDQPPRPLRVAPPRRTSSSHPGRILVVDDEPLVRRTTGKALERAGYEVCFAANGVEALGVVQGGEPVDLVVTDVQMPEMDGPAFVRRLAELGLHVPVLFVSGYPDEELAGASILGEGVEFLQKPFTLREIGDRVRRMLEA
jgi:signal transduction histidine kinase/predicted Ser/Thr protein kinase